jgi:transposase InsO family protein
MPRDASGTVRRERSQKPTRHSEFDQTRRCDQNRRARCFVILERMQMTEAQLLELYDSLSFPSPIKFRRAVIKGGDSITLKEATEFVSTFSQRQVTAPRQPYKGKVVSDALDARWAADLISYVAQEAKFEGQKYTHVLVVQDIFSRKLWTRALKTAKAKEVVKEFRDILKSSKRKPLEINTDRGVEFVSQDFATMLKKVGINMHRVALGKMT